MGKGDRMLIKDIFDTPCLISEMQKLALAYCAAQTPRGGTIAEIGPYLGGSTKILAESSKGVSVHTIDIFDFIDRKLIGDNESIRIHIGDSSAFARSNPECRIDLLFIDGDHSFHGVLHDFTHMQPLLADNATIIFHDYTQMYPGVRIFCDALHDSGAITDCVNVDGMLVCRKGKGFSRLRRENYETAAKNFEAFVAADSRRSHVVGTGHNYRRIIAGLAKDWRIIGKGSYGKYFARFFSLPLECLIDSAQADRDHTYVICSRNFKEIADCLTQRCGIGDSGMVRGDDVISYGMYSDLLANSGRLLSQMSVYEDENILIDLFSSLPESLLGYMFTTGLLTNTFKRTADL